MWRMATNAAEPAESSLSDWQCDQSLWVFFSWLQGALGEACSGHEIEPYFCLL